MSSLSAAAEGKDPAEVATIRAWEAEETHYWAKLVARNPPNDIPPMGDVIPGTSPGVITDEEIEELNAKRQRETVEALGMPRPVRMVATEESEVPRRRVIQEAPAEQGFTEVVMSEQEKMIAAQRALGVPDEGDVPMSLGLLISTGEVEMGTTGASSSSSGGPTVPKAATSSSTTPAAPAAAASSGAAPPAMLQPSKDFRVGLGLVNPPRLVGPTTPAVGSGVAGGDGGS